MRVLIRRASVLTGDEARPVREGVDLLVEDGRITEMGRAPAGHRRR
jgi:cytosine/adenosine deaminase-related metal-dependent hydrolase